MWLSEVSLGNAMEYGLRSKEPVLPAAGASSRGN
jgi:hypothetical protein